MLTTLKNLLNNNPLRTMSETDRKMFAICIGAALFFWLILNLSQTYTIRKTVSFSYILAPERTLARDSPVLSSQEVGIEGPGWDLIIESMWFRKLNVELDLRERNSLELTRSLVEHRIQRQLASGDLSVSNLDFDRQTILTAPKEGKTVPIVSRVKVKFAPGFVAPDKVNLFPDSVLVTGPGDLLEELDVWPTVDVTIDKVDESFRRSIRLAPPANSLTPSRETVEFSLRVEAFIQRTLVVPVTVINAPPVDSFQIIPATVNLSITLPQSSYDAVRADDYTVVADLGDIRSANGKNTVPLQVRRQPLATISTMLETPAVEYYLIR